LGAGGRVHLGFVTHRPWRRYRGSEVKATRKRMKRKSRSKNMECAGRATSRKLGTLAHTTKLHYPFCLHPATPGRNTNLRTLMMKQARMFVVRPGVAGVQRNVCEGSHCGQDCPAYCGSPEALGGSAALVSSSGVNFFAKTF
jgi:hypothetical protein